jgi:hypothetical protein
MRALSVPILVLLTASCAEISVHKLKENGADYTEGVRFYRPWPYLSVTKELDANKNPMFKTQFLMLPDADPTNEYVVEWKSGWFGTVNPNFNLTDGWNLVAFNGKVESGTPAVISSVASLATAVGFSEREEDKLVPGLYRMERTLLDPGPHGEKVYGWKPAMPAIYTYQQ